MPSLCRFYSKECHHVIIAQSQTWYVPWISCQFLSGLFDACFPTCRCSLLCRRARTDRSPSPGDQYTPISPGDQYTPISPVDQYTPISPGDQYTPISPGDQYTPISSHQHICPVRVQGCKNRPILRLSRTFTILKTHLKSHLFNLSFPSVWLYYWLHHWLFLYRALEAACAAYASLNLSSLHYCCRSYRENKSGLLY